jgi:hypothetical protein
MPSDVFNFYLLTCMGFNDLFYLHRMTSLRARKTIPASRPMRIPTTRAEVTLTTTKMAATTASVDSHGVR